MFLVFIIVFLMNMMMFATPSSSCRTCCRHVVRAPRFFSPFVVVVVFLLLTWFQPQPCEAIANWLAKGEKECWTEILEDHHFEWETAETMAAEVDGLIVVNRGGEMILPERYVDITVKEPDGKIVYANKGVLSEARFSVPSHGAGKYELCIHNSGGGEFVHVELVYFIPKHNLDTPDVVVAPNGHKELRETEVATKDHMNPLYGHLIELEHMIEEIESEQRHYARRQERHMKTIRSSNWRTIFYAGMEAFVFAACTFAQVAVIRGLFSLRNNDSTRGRGV